MRTDRFVLVVGLVALAVAACSASGCTVTLPFDDLTGGPPKPTAHFQFEEGTGEEAHDGPHQAFFYGLNGKPPTWTPEGRRGGGVSFSPLDGWLALTTFSQTRFPRQGTVAAWVKLKGLQDNDTTDIFGAEEDDGDEDDENDLTPISVFVEDGKLTLGLYTNVKTPPVELVTPPVDVNTWLLIVAGWDVPANRAVLFLRTEGKPDPGIESRALPDGFAIVAPSFLASANNGVMDDLRIYTRLLSDDEIRKLD